MRITESKLRRVIRQVINESMDMNSSEIDIDELCLDAIEHFYISPYDPAENHRSDGRYNAWIMHWCYDNGLRDISEIKRIIEHVKDILKDLDSVSLYLMGNQTQRGMKLAGEFSKKMPELVQYR